MAKVSIKDKYIELEFNGTKQEKKELLKFLDKFYQNKNQEKED